MDSVVFSSFPIPMPFVDEDEEEEEAVNEDHDGKAPLEGVEEGGFEDWKESS